MTSLEKIVSLCPERLYPGHGPVVEDGHAVITQYITHRNAREKQVSNGDHTCFVDIISLYTKIIGDGLFEVLFGPGDPIPDGGTYL
jgi:glyoxylase-like metal-dependent hydrolase (beta-lactamase superfamily II)